MLATAFEVGWTAEQFWASTPRELSLAIEAHRRKQEAEYDRAAWMAATIINHMPRVGKGFRAVSPRELLGKEAEPVDAADFGSREAFREYMRRQMERAEEYDDEEYDEEEG